MMMMGRIVTIIMVVIIMAGMTKTMMTTRRMLMILVLSQWQRRGGGKEHRGVRAQIRVTGPARGDSAKTCRSQIGLQSLEYLGFASWHFGLEPQLCQIQLKY